MFREILSLGCLAIWLFGCSVDSGGYVREGGSGPITQTAQLGGTIGTSGGGDIHTVIGGFRHDLERLLACVSNAQPNNATEAEMSLLYRYLIQTLDDLVVSEPDVEVNHHLTPFSLRGSYNEFTYREATLLVDADYASPGAHGEMEWNRQVLYFVWDLGTKENRFFVSEAMDQKAPILIEVLARRCAHDGEF